MRSPTVSSKPDKSIVMAAKRGRPSVYTPKIAAEICERIAKGESLREICRSEHMPDEHTVRMWHVEDREGFSPHYTRAVQARAERWAEEVVEISDDGSNDWMERNVGDGETITVADHEHISRSKLRVDTRKWLLSKVLPKVYGDKVAVTGEGGGPLVVEIVRFADAKD